MKPVLLFCFLAVLGGASLAAQDVRQDLKRLELTEAQMQQVAEIVRVSQPDLDKARAEAKVVQAQLARLLLEDNPSKTEIEKLVRQGLEWDYKAKMLRIDRSLKLRAIVGKDRWAGLSSLSQRLYESAKLGRQMPQGKDDGPALKNLLKVLKDLN